jgi:hypothetical protein
MPEEVACEQKNVTVPAALCCLLLVLHDLPRARSGAKSSL